jgi:hypothetical protein
MASYISGMPTWAIVLFIAGFLYSIAFIANPAKRAALDAGMTIILFVIVGNTKLFRKLLRSISLESLIALHVFRVLGVFDLLLYFYHLLPRNFAFSAGMGDIITAALALPVAKMISKGKPGSLKIAYAWNIFGALDIITLLVIVVINVKNAIVTGEPGPQEMTIFPFVWFPAFAPATILFLHTAIFRKIAAARTV